MSDSTAANASSMRALIGRLLCAGLGALYMAGAAPLFTFGEFGRQLWGLIEDLVTPLAQSLGVAPWIAMALIAPFAIGGPLALVWKIAGKEVNRALWLLAGVAAYGVYWWFSGR